jgi:hypothetical protein
MTAVPNFPPAPVGQQGTSRARRRGCCEGTAASPAGPSY